MDFTRYPLVGGHGLAGNDFFGVDGGLVGALALQDLGLD
jgi:hypothetical protein